jgi:hypothetical protein
MMDKKATHAVEPYVNAGYDLDAEAILLCESDGTPEEVAEEIGRMTAVLESERRHRDPRLAATKPSGCASGPGARRPFRRSGA